MERSSRQKINKETLSLNDQLNQMNKADIYEHSIQKQQITHISFQVQLEHSRIDLMLGHKAGLSKFKKTESTSTFFS